MQNRPKTEIWVYTRRVLLTAHIRNARISLLMGCYVLGAVVG